ncbi:MAG: RidA family protein [Fuerstiella sp.]
MAIQTIQTDQSPQAIGPYSQAVMAQGMLYVSGQIPLDPKTSEVISEDVAAQTKQVLDNMKAVVEAADSGMNKVVKVTIYIVDMQQFAVVNEVYATYFEAPFPARACVEVSKLPKGVQVEMDAIALLT